MNDIINHAEELALRFENLDPEDGVEISVEEFRLQRAVIARAESESDLKNAVIDARAAGVTWRQIGSLLGMSAQAAQQLYAQVV